MLYLCNKKHRFLIMYPNKTLCIPILIIIINAIHM